MTDDNTTLDTKPVTALSTPARILSARNAAFTDFIEYLKTMDVDDIFMEDAESDIAAHLREFLNTRGLIFIDIPFENELSFITDHYTGEFYPRPFINKTAFGMKDFDVLPPETRRNIFIKIIYNLIYSGHPRWQDTLTEILK